MKTKQGLILRKVGTKYMLVDNDTDNINQSNVYTMNQTAAMLWQHIGQETIDFAELTCWLCGNFEVEQEEAEADIQKTIEDWKRLGLIV